MRDRREGGRAMLDFFARSLVAAERRVQKKERRPVKAWLGGEGAFLSLFCPASRSRLVSLLPLAMAARPFAEIPPPLSFSPRPFPFSSVCISNNEARPQCSFFAFLFNASSSLSILLPFSLSSCSHLLFSSALHPSLSAPLPSVIRPLHFRRLTPPLFLSTQSRSKKLEQKK